MISRSSQLDCTRNNLCNTTNCDVDNPLLSHFSLTLVLLSCRDPPAVHITLNNGNVAVYDAVVDHSINDIDAGVGEVDITLNQLQDQDAVGLEVG